MAVIGTMKGNSAGEGSVRLTPDFEAENVVYRADVLRDILYDITNLYNRTVDEMSSPKQSTDAKKPPPPPM